MRDLLSLARGYLAECFQSQSPPHVSEFANQLGMSRAHVSQIFRTRYGVAPGKFFKNEQLECAKRLLVKTSLPVAEIARRAAFMSLRGFERAFQRATGVSPARYRRARHMVV